MILLLSRSFDVHNVIRIVWADTRLHIEFNLCSFVFVKKNKILNALFWLKEHNFLYKDIVIDHDLMNTWKNQFISIEIVNRILYHDELNLATREDYVADLENNDFENNLHHAISTLNLIDDDIFNDCLYTNVNNTRENSLAKLMTVVFNHKRDDNNETFDVELVVIYESRSRLSILNN